MGTDLFGEETDDDIGQLDTLSEAQRDHIDGVAEAIADDVEEMAEDIGLDLAGIDMDEIVSTEEQLFLFEMIEPWMEEWKGMPDFIQERSEAHRTIMVRFESEEAVLDFSRRLEQEFTRQTKSLWHPYKSHNDRSAKRWIDEEDA